jgi:hypothetical protein
MTADELRRQLAGLIGKVIVYGVRTPEHPTEFRLYAATLLLESDKLVVRCSTRNNYIAEITKHSGPTMVYPIPAPDCEYNYLALASVWQTYAADRHIRKLAADLNEAKRQRDATALQNENEQTMRAQSAEREAAATQAYTQLHAHAERTVRDRDSRIAAMMEQVTALQRQLAALQQARSASPDPSNPMYRHAEPAPLEAPPTEKGRREKPAEPQVKSGFPYAGHVDFDPTNVLTWSQLDDADENSLRDLVTALKAHYAVNVSSSHDRQLAMTTLGHWAYLAAQIPGWRSDEHMIALGTNVLFWLREVTLRELQGVQAVYALHRSVAEKADDPFIRVAQQFARGRGARPRGGRGRNMQTVKCFKCGEFGHMSTTCGKQQSGNARGGAARQL